MDHEIEIIGEFIAVDLFNNILSLGAPVIGGVLLLAWCILLYGMWRNLK